MRAASLICAILFMSGSIFSQSSGSGSEIDSLRKQLKLLKERVDRLDESARKDELQRLREAARKQADFTDRQTEKPESKTFREGSRSMQALNPELSVTGDMLTRYLVESPHYSEEARSGFLFRVLGLHFQSNLDPFSMAKVALEFSSEEIGVGEAYITWTNPFPRTTLTAGKFRQQFGVINRWHTHALDQVAFPLPIQLYMGEEGLNQTGISFDWLMPSLTASANELTVQITNSQNEMLFSGEDYGLPATLLHFKNYYDLNRSTYLEFGLSGLAGPNDDLGFTFSGDHRWTTMAGLDLTVAWSPVNREKYRGITWRSELFYLNRELPGDETITALGGYSYLDYKMSRQLFIGMRGDIAEPPLPEKDDRLLWQIVPYLTYWQSEYVFLRLEFNHLDEKNMDKTDNRITLQINWAVGPHKHERY